MQVPDEMQSSVASYMRRMMAREQSAAASEPAWSAPQDDETAPEEEDVDLEALGFGSGIVPPRPGMPMPGFVPAELSRAPRAEQEVRSPSVAEALSPLRYIWPDDFVMHFPVWGKDTVMAAVSGPQIDEINQLVAQLPPERQGQGRVIGLVAASLRSVDELEFVHADTGDPLTLKQKISEVAEWLDGLQAALYTCYLEVEGEHAKAIRGLLDPNSFARPETTTTRW